MGHGEPRRRRPASIAVSLKLRVGEAQGIDDTQAITTRIDHHMQGKLRANDPVVPWLVVAISQNGDLLGQVPLEQLIKFSREDVAVDLQLFLHLLGTRR